VEVDGRMEMERNEGAVVHANELLTDSARGSASEMRRTILKIGDQKFERIMSFNRNKVTLFAWKISMEEWNTKEEWMCD